MAVGKSWAGRGTGAAVLAIVVAQWFGTSLWFSSSGAVDGLSAWLVHTGTVRLADCGNSDRLHQPKRC